MTTTSNQLVLSVPQMPAKIPVPAPLPDMVTLKYDLLSSGRIILNVYFSILEEIQELLLQLSNGLISNVFPTRNVNVSGEVQLSLLVNNVVIPMVLLLAWVILVVRLPSNKEEKTFFSEMFHGDTTNAQHRAIQECTLETLSPQFILGSRQTPVSRFTLLIYQKTYFCPFINTNCIYNNKLFYLWYNLRRNSFNQSLLNQTLSLPFELIQIHLL